jgi:Putative silver efflux pump
VTRHNPNKFGFCSRYSKRSMGLLPAALSSGMGSEIQKPLAIMIVGGVILCMLLSFIVLSQVFYFAYRRDKRLKKG